MADRAGTEPREKPSGLRRSADGFDAGEEVFATDYCAHACACQRSTGARIVRSVD